MTHDCPAKGCLAPVPVEQLACRKHWALVSRPTQQRVYREYRAGTMAGHAAAMQAAVEEMNAAIDALTAPPAKPEVP